MDQDVTTAEAIAYLKLELGRETDRASFLSQMIEKDAKALEEARAELVKLRKRLVSYGLAIAVLEGNHHEVNL
jgi:hypothetical protein